MNKTEPATSTKPQKSWGFFVFMALLTGLFVLLGNWQMNRLSQKETMLSDIAQRSDNAPIPLPPASEWVGFDPQVYDFRPLQVTGTFDHSGTILVFTSLVEPRGQFSGPGYWVVAPFLLENGGAIFVNRGFVPERLASQFKDGGAGPLGTITITGMGRVSEKTNAFTPGTDFKNRVEWVRNVDRLKQQVDRDIGPFVQLYLDEQAGPDGALPQGGETRLTITNRHFEYAITWYSLAILTPILLFFWWRQSLKTARNAADKS